MGIARVFAVQVLGLGLLGYSHFEADSDVGVFLGRSERNGTQETGTTNLGIGFLSKRIGGADH